MKEITTNRNILNENSELLQEFFKDINKYPVLTGDEQIELARKIKNGDKEARDKLITSNLRFIVTCAKQYVGQGVSLMDLIQSGIVGLCLSIDNYDPDRGYKFLSFAVWYIRREIIKSIYNNGRTIRYPVSYIAKITKVKKEYDNFVTKNQREPTDEELIQVTNLSQRQYTSTIINKSYCQSFDTPISDDATLEDILVEPEKPFVDQFAKDTISNVLKILNNREYKVISEFYGLDGKEERSIKEIAKDMGLGDERIRQIRKNAIKKLRTKKGITLATLL